MDRMPKVNDMLQKTLGEVFREELEIPFDFFISITEVDCAPDLKTAKVFLSVLPFTKTHEGMAWIINRRKQIQKELGKRFKLKNTPILRFEIDERGETADRIYSLMDSVELPPTPKGESPI